MTSWHLSWFKAQDLSPYVRLLSEVSKWQLLQDLLSLIIFTQWATTWLSILTPNFQQKEYFGARHVSKSRLCSFLAGGLKVVVLLVVKLGPLIHCLTQRRYALLDQ